MAQDTTFTEFGQALDAAEHEITSGVSAGENQSTASVDPSSGNGGEQGNGKDGGSSAQPSANPTTPNGDTPKAPTGAGPANSDAEKQRKYNNFLAAQRRFRAKRENPRTQQRIRELSKERDDLLQLNDEQSTVLAHQKDSQIQDLMAAEQDRLYNEWLESAYQTFGEDTEKFVADSTRWSPYIVKHEPELQGMINRQYGQLLLKCWMDRMDNPESRQQWLDCDSYEKQKILHSLYKQIGQLVDGTHPILRQQQQQGAPQGGQAPQQQQQQPQQRQVVNAPVPGSGRDTNQIPPTDDFGLALQGAANECGVKWN